MVSEWHKEKELTPKFHLEKQLSMTKQTKTIVMQRDHIIWAWKKEIEELRSNAKVLGPRTRQYYESCADSLEKALEIAMTEMNKISYIEID